MDDPISWKAVEAIADIIRGITKANGYHTDLGLGRVITDDDQVDDDDEEGATTPATIIEATDINVSDSRFNDEMQVTIEFVIPRRPGLGNPKQLAHRGAADIRKILRLSENARGRPPGIRQIQPSGARLRGWTDDAAQISYVIAQVTARVGLTDTSQ